MRYRVIFVWVPLAVILGDVQLLRGIDSGAGLAALAALGAVVVTVATSTWALSLVGASPRASAAAAGIVLAIAAFGLGLPAAHAQFSAVMAMDTVAGTSALALIGSIGLAAVSGVLMAMRAVRRQGAYRCSANVDDGELRASIIGRLAWCGAVVVPLSVVVGTPAQLFGAGLLTGGWALVVTTLLFLPSALLAGIYVRMTSDLLVTAPLDAAAPRQSWAWTRTSTVIGGVVVVWLAFAPLLRPIHGAVSLLAFFACDPAESSAGTSGCPAPWLWGSWLLTAIFTALIAVTAVTMARTSSLSNLGRGRQANVRQKRRVRTTRWTLAALGVQVVGSLWLTGQALYVAPLLVLVTLVPVALTALAYVCQKLQWPTSPTVLLACSCALEAGIVYLGTSVYWESAADVLAVPTPPGTLEPFALLAFSYWVWHLTLPTVAIALVAQLVGARQARTQVSETDS